MFHISNKISQNVEEKTNPNNKKVTVTTEEFTAQVGDSQVLTVSKVSFSNTDVIDYNISSDSYRLNLRKAWWGGFFAQVETLEDSEFFPRIFVDIPLEQDEEIKVGVKTTAFSHLLDAQQTQEMSEFFGVAARNLEWIKEVMDNLEVLEEI